MAEIVASLTRGFGNRINESDSDYRTLASVGNERYGTGMGIRKIQVSPTDNEISDWYPAKRVSKYPGELRQIDELRQIEESAFGSISPAEVIRQVLFDGKGEVYVDQPLLPVIHRKRIYAIVRLILLKYPAVRLSC